MLLLQSRCSASPNHRQAAYLEAALVCSVSRIRKDSSHHSNNSHLPGYLVPPITRVAAVSSDNQRSSHKLRPTAVSEARSTRIVPFTQIFDSVRKQPAATTATATIGWIVWRGRAVYWTLRRGSAKSTAATAKYARRKSVRKQARWNRPIWCTRQQHRFRSTQSLIRQHTWPIH